MALAVGTRLGAYEITGELGAGGMGEVYRATDTDLSREAAIKILPPAFASDADRIARFRREAEALAALNHPNIAQIYGIVRSGETTALAMELVEGRTLADRIAEGPIPTDEALDIAVQIADALEAAHEQGIVHRDLKPANVQLKPDGTVKVLDFGIATAPESTVVTSGQRSPTLLTPALTEAGVLLGTAAYMSPEQARGRAVDRRADIWAFGCVLYEMLTGQPAFGGEDVTTTLADVLKSEPDLGGVPFETLRLLRACLKKDPQQRLRDIGDMRLMLDAAPASPAKSSRMGWIAAAVLGVAALAMGIAHFRTPAQAGAEQVRFLVPPPNNTLIYSGYFAISPDGRKIVFSAVASDAQPHLWVRSIGLLEAKMLPNTEGGRSPFWSPDGQYIGFYADYNIKKIAATGGTPQVVCRAAAGNRGQSWSPMGVIIWAGAVVEKCPADGGNSVPVTKIDESRQELFHARPLFLPDGRHFLYIRASNDPEKTGMYVSSIDDRPGQAPKRVMGGLVGPGFAKGRLYFLRQHQLMSQAFDTVSVELKGAPALVVDGVGDNGNAMGYFSIAPTGAVAFRRTDPGTRLTWVDREGRNVGGVGDVARYDEVEISPDGNQAAVPRYGANHDIWLMDLVRGVSTRFTTDPAWDDHPIWSPDGSQIVFRSVRGKSRSLFLKPTSAARDEQKLLDLQDPATPLDWSRDGRYLLYRVLDASTREDLWIMENPLGPPSERKMYPYLATHFRETQARFSPDGHWIAYTSDQSGRTEVYVRPFPIPANGGTRYQVSTEGGRDPRWRRDGKELFFISNDSQMMSAEFNGGAFDRNPPKALWRVPSSLATGDTMQWDVSTDGKRFLIDATTSASGSPIAVILNLRR